MKGILLVTNYFENDSRVLKEALSLHRAGYDITVAALYKEGLQPYEERQGIKIQRIKLRTKNWGHNPLSLFLKYAEFVIRAIWRFRQADFIHCNDLDTLPVGWWIRTLGKNKKVIYDAHEFEIDQRENASLLRKKLLFWAERFFIRKASGVLTVGEIIADEYARLYPIARPTVVMNCPHRQERHRSTLLRDKFRIGSDEKLFIYQGAFMPGRGIELLLEAFQTLPPKYKIVFMGYGSLEEMIKEKAARFPTIFYHPPVPYAQILDYTASADYGMSLIEDVCFNNRNALPNKFFEYINAGLPVIVYSHGEMASIVNRYRLGYVWDEKTESLADFLKKIPGLAFHPARIGNQYTWENEEKKLISFYQTVLENE